jgi:hypothetical protein
MGSAAGVTDEPESSEIETIGQLLDVARPVEEFTTRLVGRTAESRPLRADEPNTSRNSGGFQQAAGESGIVAAMEEHDRPARFGAEFSPAERSAIESRHLKSLSVGHSTPIPGFVLSLSDSGHPTWGGRRQARAARCFGSAVPDDA